MRWLGRPWVQGTHECSQFVALVLRHEFNRDIALPAPALSMRLRELQVRNGLALGRAVATASPREGDGVLTVLAAGVRVKDYHIGVYVEAGAPMMLHCPRDGHSCLTAIADLEQLGQELEGYYAWT